MKNNLQNITKLFYVLLATFPFLKPNHNSIIIIFCTIFCIIDLIRTKRKIKIHKPYLVLIFPFFMFFVYELVSLKFNLTTVLLGLPFLIFPVLFLYKPKYIDKTIFYKSIIVFQLSTIFQSFVYLLVFLKENSIETIFNISPENIPFFRAYVTERYLVELHPTYYSSFLLISITFSLFHFSRSKILNSVFITLSTIFLFIFSSRIIITLFLLTFISFFLIKIIKGTKKSNIIYAILGILILTYLGSSKVVSKRFNEILTEINKPVVGDYYNSTNTRIAIYKCDFQLIKSVPFWGFGSDLQNKLNECYQQNNQSDFYKISVFNTHNYYINLILYGGWVFFFFFIIYLIFSYNFLKNSALSLFIYVQFLIINLTENYLSRHYGLVTFTYFIMLLIYHKSDEE